MASLIAFASKHGMTREYAQLMAEALGKDTKLIDLSKGESKGIDVSSYDTVVLGSSVYAGMVRPALKAFIKTRGSELKAKKLGLFLCGLASGPEGNPALEAAYPESLRSVAKAQAYLPGRIDLASLGGFERFIMNMVQKSQAKEGKAPKPAPTAQEMRDQASAFLKALK